MVIGIDYFPKLKAEEYSEADRLIEQAFGVTEEVALVHRLRADGDMWWETAVHLQGELAGYMGLSRMVAPQGWACLAPLAVLPKYQNGAGAPNPSLTDYFRVGSRMAGAFAHTVTAFGGSADSKDVPAAVVVLGKRSFYERAGFSWHRARRLTSPYPLEHTLIATPGDDIPEATLIYPPAFESLG